MTEQTPFMQERLLNLILSKKNTLLSYVTLHRAICKDTVKGTFSKFVFYVIEKSFITNTTMDISVQEINLGLLSCVAP